MSRKRESDTREEERESILRKRERIADEEAVETEEEEKEESVLGRRQRIDEEEDAFETGEEEKGTIPGNRNRLAKEEDAFETGEEEKGEATRARAAEEERKRAVEEWMHLGVSAQRALALVATSDGPFTAVDTLYQRCVEQADQLGATIMAITFGLESLTEPDSTPWFQMASDTCTAITRLKAHHLQAGNLLSLCASHINSLDDPLWQCWNEQRVEVDRNADEALEFMLLAYPHLEIRHHFLMEAQGGGRTFGPRTHLVLLQSAVVQLKEARAALRRLSSVARLECMAADRLVRRPL